MVNGLSMLCLHLQIFLGCFRELRLLEVLVKLLEAGVIALRGRVMNKPAVLSVLSIRRFDVLLRGVVGVGAGVLADAARAWAYPHHDCHDERMRVQDRKRQARFERRSCSAHSGLSAQCESFAH